ncbi:hypothetical protein QN360_01165 [Glaciimonas sp. CA11.2]|uniref:hypothetical protein n=1 Tax=Glaciimonas sp. CA11.2 TaxID=3048601 RepID=UPI002AB453FD|nr:hypothetical protein [Glaciimonas sp. CA11.2]MDY7549193.1 hypothetical protein [Glaciimonas sp. CA11.2]MEB0161514.1 hypothetical protein [Glaciimonas sp. CA11.2]
MTRLKQLQGMERYCKSGSRAAKRGFFAVFVIMLIFEITFYIGVSRMRLETVGGPLAGMMVFFCAVSVCADFAGRWAQSKIRDEADSGQRKR